jgi:hypothetical protein
MSKRLALIAAAVLAFPSTPVWVQAAEQPGASAEAAAPAPDWIARSNAYTLELLHTQARFFPENAAESGLEEYDGLVRDMAPDLAGRYTAALEQQLARYQSALGGESDPNLRQDLEILIAAIEQEIEGTRLSERLMLDWYDVPQMVFGTLNSVLSDQTAPERRAKAKELLERYTGLHPETEPMTELAKARFEESRGDGKVGPFRGSVEDTLPKIGTYVAGIRELFGRFGIEAPQALDAMERQFGEYGDWERATVLPAARDDFRLPPELYAFRLKAYGIDLPPEELIARARRSFYEIRQQMDALAPLVAEKQGFAASDTPSVLAELKKQRIAPERMEEHYAGLLAQLQEITARERIVTLPVYPVNMRLGSEAENAASPAPHMQPPRLIGNTGERGTFVLTTGVTSGSDVVANDFDFEAAAWTLSVHEGRPGHELQFAQMVERGVSNARAIYAFNSTNAEGWALYAEAEMLPYEPLEGQLIALQHRLLRASRAMLDPMLNLGLTDPETAERVLAEEAGFSPAMVKQEVDRYTFRAPGQAGSYFYGYSQLIDLRAATELALGDKFDRLAFNDFVIGQGLLPLDLLAKAVREEFIPAQLGR